MKTQWCPQKQRRNDEVLMDVFTRTLPEEDLIGVNACRICLKVNTIAEITMADGITIHTEVLHVTKPPRRSKLSWPNQTRPGPKYRESCAKALKIIAQENGKLYNPIGNWIRPSDQQWQYFSTRTIASDVLKYKEEEDNRYKQVMITGLHVPIQLDKKRVIGTVQPETNFYKLEDL